VQAGPEDQRLPLSLPKRCGCLHCWKWKTSLLKRTQTKPRARDVRKRVTRAPEEPGRIVMIMPSAFSWFFVWRKNTSLPYKMHFWRATWQFKRLNCERVGWQWTCDTFKTRGIGRGNLQCALCPDITAHSLRHTHIFILCALHKYICIYYRRANATDTKSPRAHEAFFIVWESAWRDAIDLCSAQLAYREVFRIIKIKCSLTTWFRCGADSLVTYVSMCTLIQFLFAALLFYIASCVICAAVKPHIRTWRISVDLICAIRTKRWSIMFWKAACLKIHCFFFLIIEKNTTWDWRNKQSSISKSNLMRILTSEPHRTQRRIICKSVLFMSKSKNTIKKFYQRGVGRFHFFFFKSAK